MLGDLSHARGSSDVSFHPCSWITSRPRCAQGEDVVRLSEGMEVLMPQKRTPGSRTDKGPTPEKGGPARRMSTREATAMRRRDALVEQLQKSGLSREKALERAMETMRDNGRGDWRNG
jgi:hypothetical protein